MAFREHAARPLEEVTVRLSATDPLNLTGILLPGSRVPAVRGKEILLVDGLPHEPTASESLALGTAS